jgi:hypothetical protein
MSDGSLAVTTCAAGSCTDHWHSAAMAADRRHGQQQMQYGDCCGGTLAAAADASCQVGPASNTAIHASLKQGAPLTVQQQRRQSHVDAATMCQEGTNGVSSDDVVLTPRCAAEWPPRPQPHPSTVNGQPSGTRIQEEAPVPLSQTCQPHHMPKGEECNARCHGTWLHHEL